MNDQTADMPPEDNPAPRKPMTPKLFFAWFFMILGGGVALLTGGCGLFLFVTFLLEYLNTGRTGFIPFWVPLIIGGIPALVGSAVFGLGWWLRRRT